MPQGEAEEVMSGGTVASHDLCGLTVGVLGDVDDARAAEDAGDVDDVPIRLEEVLVKVKRVDVLGTEFVARGVLGVREKTTALLAGDVAPASEGAAETMCVLDKVGARDVRLAPGIVDGNRLGASG